MQFFNLEVRRKSIQQSLPKIWISVDVVVQENTLPSYVSDHTIRMAKYLVTIPRDDDQFGKEKVFKGIDKRFPAVMRILLEDLVCHNNFVSTRYDIAAVHDDIRGDAVQAKFLADCFVLRDISRVALKVIRIIPIQEKEVLLQLDRHIIPRPDILYTLCPRQPLKFNSLTVQGLDKRH